MPSAKVKCICCKERKDPCKFCSNKFSVYMCGRFNIPIPPVAKDKSLPLIFLCNACHRTLCKKENQKQHNRRPKYKLSRNIRTGISKSFRTGKSGLWESRVGYTLAELREYLQSQFQPNMSWANYGKWHIDHIKPVSSFDFNSYEQEAFKSCWSLSNLRPLWAKDNWMRKKNRQPMRKCFDESPYASCLDCPRTVHIKYRGLFCQRFHRKVPQWWETF